MSQKIYSDRTELEGVDLPSAGQTKLLVIGDDKKLKSEPKPTIPTKTSDLTNDGDGESTFITQAEAELQFVEPDDLGSAAFKNSSYTVVNGTVVERHALNGSIEVNTTSGDKSAVNIETLNSRLANRIPVVRHTVHLDKSQINNLNSSPVSILWSDMGLANTQKIRWRPELTVFTTNDDGTPFVGSMPVQIGRYPIQGVISIPVNRYTSNGQYAGFPVQESCNVGVEPEFIIETASAISGGGTNAAFKIDIYFEIDSI